MISIIIATKNCKLNLIDLLASLNLQTVKEFEIIICDNSTDDTLSVLNDFKNLNINLASKVDTGIYNAWNKAISASKYDFVSFIGSDDFIYPNYIEEMIKLIKSYPQCNIFLPLSKRYHPIKNNFYITNKNPINTKIMNYLPFSHRCSVFNKSFLMERPFNEQYRISSDYDHYLSYRNDYTSINSTKIIVLISSLGLSDLSYKVAIENFSIRLKKINLLYVLLLFLYESLYLSLNNLNNIINQFRKNHLIK